MKLFNKEASSRPGGLLSPESRNREDRGPKMADQDSNSVSEVETKNRTLFQPYPAVKKTKKNESKSEWFGVVKTLLYVLLTFVIFLGLITFILAILNAIAVARFPGLGSGNNAGSVVVAIAAVLAAALAAYGARATSKGKRKPLHVTSGGLVVTSIILIMVSIAVINIDYEDQRIIDQSMLESMRRAQDGSVTDLQLWNKTQFELSCCGVYGPDDYRRLGFYIVPEVPRSCCPEENRIRQAYPGATSAVQVCRMRKLYFHEGCRDKVVERLSTSAVSLLSLSVGLAIVSLLAVPTALGLSKLQKPRSKEEIEKPKTKGSADDAEDPENRQIEVGE